MSFQGKGRGTVSCQAMAYELAFCDAGVYNNVPTDYCPNCGRVGFGQFYVTADTEDSWYNDNRWQGIIHCRLGDLEHHPRVEKGYIPRVYYKYWTAMRFWCTKKKILASQFMAPISTSCWLPSPTETEEGGEIGHEAVPERQDPDAAA
jgi:hypothetical protein